MTPDTDQDDVRRLLERAGIEALAQDLPFLQRTLVRQRDVLRTIGLRVGGSVEPAHVFSAGDARAPLRARQ